MANPLSGGQMPRQSHSPSSGTRLVGYALACPDESHGKGSRASNELLRLSDISSSPRLRIWRWSSLGAILFASADDHRKMGERGEVFAMRSSLRCDSVPKSKMPIVCSCHGEL